MSEQGLLNNRIANETMIDDLIPNELLNKKVIKRDRSAVAFDGGKIFHAIKMAFTDVYGNVNSLDNTGGIKAIFEKILTKIDREYSGITSITIEDIQDKVEEVLGEAEYWDVVRSYMIYRYERKQKRVVKQVKKLMVHDPSGRIYQYQARPIKALLKSLCSSLKDIDINAILSELEKSLFDGVSYIEVMNALVLCIRTKIEQNPDYSYLAARVQRHILLEETISFFKGEFTPITPNNYEYQEYFDDYLKHGIDSDLLSSKLLEFDIDAIKAAIKPENDKYLNYLSIRTLYDRYFIHVKDIRIELPQFFFMRVAMGLCIEEKNSDNQSTIADKTNKAINFYHALSNLDYMCSTPTLFNAGTNRPQLSSCFLTTIDDDLNDIYNSIKDNALLSKFAGGIGNDWSNVRGARSRIHSTNGVSDGIVPFLNVADATAIAVNQGGKRKGAVCAYLTTWHIDILEFLELRKNTGDDRRRTHDMNTANWIPDLFFKRLINKEDWTLFSPCDVPGLHDAHGNAFEELYRKYEKEASIGKIPHKKIPALTLWRKMLSMLFETGHPWLTFKDPCNVRSPQQHCGTIHSSNLCTEITLNTSSGVDGEVAVCNLGSINLLNHVDQEGNILHEKLKKTIKQAVRLLDNVIDINYYTIPQARRSNMRHRPIGLGLMGFQDVLYLKKLSYEDPRTEEFADECMELISYYAIDTSIDLAAEKGRYESYEGSLWSQGILPFDSINLLEESRGNNFLDMNRSVQMDWQPIRDKLREHGIRNSNIMAIAPTATISNICGVTQSIEPMYQHLFVKSNMSGEFTIINPHLIKDLQKSGLWDRAMMMDIKFHNGSVQNIERIPQELKALYKTAFEIDPMVLVNCASRRQKWIDQSQSLNLYMSQPSGKKLDALYQHAWIKGLKTTYYLRSLGATSSERSTVSDGALNAVKSACSIDDPDCEACQ